MLGKVGFGGCYEVNLVLIKVVFRVIKFFLYVGSGNFRVLGRGGGR